MSERGNESVRECEGESEGEGEGMYVSVYGCDDVVVQMPVSVRVCVCV